MRVIYFDCFSGVSGDMILGALVDAGLELGRLKRELCKLKLKGYRLSKRRVKRQGLAGTKVDFFLTTKHKPRFTNLKEITALINKSELKKEVKNISGEIFLNLARAERKVHGVKKEHFHQVGDIDSIIDIVGAVIGLDLLAIKKVYCSPLSLGCAHSPPIPAPATISLLKGYPCLFSQQPYELVTPTGAATIATLSEKNAPLPLIKPLRIGYGAGTRSKGEIPNLLRVVIGETADSNYEQDRILIVEASIDDTSPLVYEHLWQRLSRAGALDAYIAAIQMKKMRPGVLFTVLIPPELLAKVSSIIFEETSTLGIRYYQAHRYKLHRQIKQVNTKYGKVRVKLGIDKGKVSTISPEYDDCKKIAGKKNIPLRVIYEEAQISAKKGGKRK